MNVVISIGRCQYLVNQAEAIKIMTAMSKAVEVDTQHYGEWNERRDFRVRYVAQRNRSRITITEVDDDQIIIPPDIADEVSPAHARKVRKQIGGAVRQLPSPQ